MAEGGGGGRIDFDEDAGMFSWVVPSLKNKRAIKTLIRCSAVLSASMILLVDQKTLDSMGQAGLFAAILATMLPPYMALSLFIFACITLILGMLIGWAWGAAAMAAALSVRSQSLLAQQQQVAQSMIVPDIPVAFQQQRFIFSGLFLDPRSSAVYGAFFFIGTFALGALRAFVPKLSLLCIFACIVLDVMCTNGPSLPVARYTIAKTFLMPTAYYIAIAVASILLLFPESLNHVWLTTLRSGFLEPTLELLSLQSAALHLGPSDRESWKKQTKKGNMYRRALAAGTEGLLGQVALIDLEFSVGRLGPTDLKNIAKELKSFMFRAVALHSFQSYVNDMNGIDEREAAAAEASLNQGTATPRSGDRYTNLRKEIKERERQHGHDLDTLIPLLEDASKDLRNSCEDGLKAIMDWFQKCNSGRWADFFTRLNKANVKERHKTLEAKLHQLEASLAAFRRSEKEKLIAPFKRFFDPVTGKVLDSVMKDRSREMFAARSLFMCFVFMDSLDTFAERLLHLLQVITDLDSRRPKARIWAPSGFGKLWRKLTSRVPVDNDVSPLMMGTSSDPANADGTSSNDDDSDGEEESDILKSARKNPDALPPRTPAGKLFVSLGGIIRFLKSNEGIYALRHGIVSVALWIPCVCSSSAWFYYEHNGFWALIMAQTGLAMFAGDQIYEFITRISGTILGLLVGMATWYIGAGRGDGNPYGVVIATTALCTPFIFARLNAPASQMTIHIMIAVTIIFVVAYSWINTHFVTLVNSGVGVHLGWKRALLVIIGFAGAFAVMMFPHPNSSRTLVRRTLGGTAAGLGHILAEEVEAFLAEEALARRGQYEKVEFIGEDAEIETVSAKEKRVRKLANRVLAVATRLQSIQPSLERARFEPQLQGTWPYEQYNRLHEIQMQILLSLVLLISAFPRLDTRWCSILVNRTPFLNPNLLSDIFSHLSILSNCLLGPHALPVALPNLRDRAIYHERHSKVPHVINRAALDNAGSEVKDDESSDEHARLDFAAGRVDGSTMGLEEITLEILMDEQLPAHSTAIVALSSIISLIDEMTGIVRSLCGEVSFRGYDMLHNSFLDREERALGSGFSSKFQ